MADVIKFEFDHPVEVALRFSEPRVFPSQFDGGDDRHMFSTTDGRVMYVTPLTAARIAALHLAQGECFFVCKRKNGRITEFSVSREPMEITAAAPKPARPPAPFKSNLPERLYYVPATAQEPAAGPPTLEEGKVSRKVSQSPESLTVTLEEQLRASIDMVNRRNAVQAPAKPSAESRLAPAVVEFSARLVLETTALVDVYAAVLKTASERHGNAVKADDVRSLLVTACINAAKQGGRNAA